MSRAEGSFYEDRAAELLESHGWKILERNFTAKIGELDLICEDPEGVLVFVEVRQRSSLGFGSAAETIGRGKIRKVIRTAQLWLQARGFEDRDCRFDVVAIDGDELEHFEDAFQAS